MADERAADLLKVGTQCSHPICGLVDFLPFNCQHCKKSFCQEHFKVEAHSCNDYDESKFNRVAPDCPLCKKPIAIRPGEDPNIRMDRHLETECYVMTGKSQKPTTTPRCTHCRKILFSPIKCNDCNEQFCPSHRFPGDHTCISRAGKVAQRVAGPSHTSNLLAKFDSTAKRLMQTTSTPTPTKRATPAGDPTSSSSPIAASSSSATPTTPSSSKPKMTLPFSKADRPPSVFASSISTVTSTPTPATTTNNNLTIDAASSALNTSSNNSPSIFNISSFIPRPIFASA